MASGNMLAVGSFNAATALRPWTSGLDATSPGAGRGMPRPAKPGPGVGHGPVNTLAVRGRRDRCPATS